MWVLVPCFYDLPTGSIWHALLLEGALQRIVLFIQKSILVFCLNFVRHKFCHFQMMGRVLKAVFCKMLIFTFNLAGHKIKNHKWFFFFFGIQSLVMKVYSVRNNFLMSIDTYCLRVWFGQFFIKIANVSLPVCPQSKVTIRWKKKTQTKSNGVIALLCWGLVPVSLKKRMKTRKQQSDGDSKDSCFLVSAEP